MSSKEAAAAADPLEDAPQGAPAAAAAAGKGGRGGKRAREGGAGGGSAKRGRGGKGGGSNIFSDTPGASSEILAATEAALLEYSRINAAEKAAQAAAQQRAAVEAGAAGGGDEVAVEQSGWVACDACGKWRSVPPHIDLKALTSASWTCSMNSWSERLATAACSAPEESWTVDATASVGAAGEGASETAADAHAPEPPAAAAGGRGKARSGSLATGAAEPVPTSSTPAAGGPGKGGKKKTAKEAAAGKGRAAAAAKKEVQWVQCENPACMKWRRLAPDMDVTDLPSSAWACRLNTWDPHLASCDAPEETGDDTTDAAAAAAGSPPAALASRQSGATPAAAAGGGGKASASSAAALSRGVSVAGFGPSEGPSASRGACAEEEAPGGREAGGGEGQASGSGSAAAEPDSGAPEQQQGGPGEEPAPPALPPAEGAEEGSGGTGSRAPAAAASATAAGPAPSPSAPPAAPAPGAPPKKKAKRSSAALLLADTAAIHAGSSGRLGSSSGPVGPGLVRTGGKAGAGGGKSLRHHAHAAPIIAWPPASAALPPLDRRTFLPPTYTMGHRDYHHMLLLHPPEVWADPNAGGGVQREAVRGAWVTASNNGVALSGPPLGQHAKFSFRDMVSISWGSKAKVSSAGERSHASIESGLRWTKSSVYCADGSAAATATLGPDAVAALRAAGAAGEAPPGRGPAAAAAAAVSPQVALAAQAAGAACARLAGGVFASLRRWAAEGGTWPLGGEGLPDRPAVPILLDPATASSSSAGGSAGSSHSQPAAVGAAAAGSSLPPWIARRRGAASAAAPFAPRSPAASEPPLLAPAFLPSVLCLAVALQALMADPTIGAPGAPGALGTAAILGALRPFIAPSADAIGAPPAAASPHAYATSDSAVIAPSLAEHGRWSSDAFPLMMHVRAAALGQAASEVNDLRQRLMGMRVEAEAEEAAAAAERAAAAAARQAAAADAPPDGEEGGAMKREEGGASTSSADGAEQGIKTGEEEAAPSAPADPAPDAEPPLTAAEVAASGPFGDLLLLPVELPLRSGANRVGEPGFLCTPPYAAHVSAAMQRRGALERCLLCLVALDLGAAVTPASTAAVAASVSPRLTPHALGRLLSSGLLGPLLGADAGAPEAVGPLAAGLLLSELDRAGLAEDGDGRTGWEPPSSSSSSSSAAASGPADRSYRLSPAGRGAVHQAFLQAMSGPSPPSPETGGLPASVWARCALLRGAPSGSLSASSSASPSGDNAAVSWLQVCRVACVSTAGSAGPVAVPGGLSTGGGNASVEGRRRRQSPAPVPGGNASVDERMKGDGGGGLAPAYQHPTAGSGGGGALRCVLPPQIGKPWRPVVLR